MNISIVGASGYTGGELLRLLLNHPGVTVQQATSQRFANKPVSLVHPHLRGQTDLRFSATSELEPCDLVFTATPHGTAMHSMPGYLELAPRVLDLSADFRLRDPQDYIAWYGQEHANPELLQEAVYGCPELHRQEIKDARLVSGVGCLATSAIYPLYPLVQEGIIDTNHIVVDSKIGSTAAGNKFNLSTHHPERAGIVRCYRPTMHRQTAEMQQELSVPVVSFSSHAVEMVRGILSTCHVFLTAESTEKDVWNLYRQYYSEEPFIRIIKQRTGMHRYPEPRLLAGTNYCDIGFELDTRNNRLVLMSAIDNLMKGASGQAVQCMNIMLGLDETTGLEFGGLHP